MHHVDTPGATFALIYSVQSAIAAFTIDQSWQEFVIHGCTEPSIRV